MTTTETSKTITLKNNIDYSKNSIVSQQLFKNKQGGITLFAFDKGQQLSEHTAPFDAIFQIVDGLAEISLDGVLYQVTEGEMIIMPANIPHAVYATTAFKMVLTMIRESK